LARGSHHIAEAENYFQNLYIYLCQRGYVFINVSQLFCLIVSRILQKKTLNRFFSRKFDRKVAHWPRKKPLDFGDNPDHVTLELGLVFSRVTVRWGGAPPYCACEDVLLGEDVAFV